MKYEQAKEIIDRRNDREVRFDLTGSSKKHSPSTRKTSSSESLGSLKKTSPSRRKSSSSDSASSRNSPSYRRRISPSKFVPICEWEDRGKCRLGDKCNMRHPATTCSSFSKLGSCYDRKICESRHPESVCFSWQRSGACRRGDECRYRHPVGSSPSSSPSRNDEIFLGSTQRTGQSRRNSENTQDNKEQNHWRRGSFSGRNHW